MTGTLNSYLNPTRPPDDSPIGLIGAPRPKRYNFIAVLSPEDVAEIRAKIERLEEARKRVNDSGILKQIDLWIADEKKKLADNVSRNAA